MSQAVSAEVALHQEVHALYSNHHGWLSNWLRGKLGNSCDAADLAQDVFMRLLARRQSIGAREPRALLSTIAHGLVVDHWRRRELERAWLDTLAALPEPLAPSPENRHLVLEALYEIDRMLDTLPPAVRQAFLLAQLDGLTCPQIAERLAVSLATVERYLAKALKACYFARFAE
ncbi:MAG: sigma-70 family RNA polymerase sigma factor [Rhodocyclaceae bacterium]